MHANETAAELTELFRRFVERNDRIVQATIERMDLDALRNQFLIDGYGCIENVVLADRLAEIRENVDRDVSANSWIERPTGYVPVFLRGNRALTPYLASAPVLALVWSFFGPQVWISMITGTVNGHGISRGYLHAEFPYNQSAEAHIPAPYPDCVLHIVTFWMLSGFTAESGGTIIVPGSHRKSDHPRAVGAIDPAQTHFVRLGATACHRRASSRATGPAQPCNCRLEIVEAYNGKDSQAPPISREAFDILPPDAKPLLRFMVDAN